jgi:hypothetical protein
MSMTRVRFLDTKKSGHFKKTLLQSIPSWFGHAYPKSCCRANRRASRVPRPCMHARAFVRSPSARDSFGALYDRGRGKLTERAAMTTYNVACVIAFKTKALLASFKKPFARCCVARFARRQTRSGVVSARGNDTSTRLIIAGHQRKPRPKPGRTGSQ